ncbi:FGGY family carbohydrate kinase [Cellvibrio sp. NN19]|uniref:FGGY family carbohydrate kinase n=1 Tax=Cellvibrio chitinivorans TaxID=3102792 RepID=UPI002B40FEE7|nr:FGGY family carbohydrate kinase [Cellvibrio sp. NN19]
MSNDLLSTSSTHNPDLFLAIDQGGQSTRIAIYTGSGEHICSYSAACATQHHQVENSPYPYIEQNGEEILAGIRTCLQKIQHQHGDDINRIKAASFAGQGSSLLCWNNQTGEALTPVLSWQDIRGEPYLYQTSLTNEQVQKLTGLRLSPHYGASKMRWCLEYSEKVAQAQQNNCLSIGPIVSYIFWHLCDNLSANNRQPLVDPGHAQRTLLWNLQRNDWDQSLLDAFQIPREILPHCRYHNSDFGSFSLGDHNIPFTTSARDQGASLFARGMPEAGSVYINIGTGAFIQRLSESLHAPDGLLVSPLWLPENTAAINEQIEVASPTCYAEEFECTKVHKSLYAWEATVNGAASAISFMQQQTGLQITPQEIDSTLGLNPTGDCYFLNSVGGLSAPYWRTDLESQFSNNLSPNEKILAWIESVIFQIVVNVQLMNQLGAAEKIIISGGFSKSDSVCQKIADLTQARVHRSDNTDATVQGAACMAAGLPQSWSPLINEEIFIPQQNRELEHRFAKWQQAMVEWLG